MKKYILVAILASSFHFLASFNIYAISPTNKPSPISTPSENPSHLSDQIDNLKDRIASRVAQLKLVEKRGTIGIVAHVSNTQITISNLQNNTRFVDVDELTKFASPSAKGSFGISDINKGAKLGVIGLYNKQSKRILARFVNVIITPVVIRGVVSVTDPKNFTLIIRTVENKQYVIDIENTTKTQTYTKDEGLVKSGFSKFQTNDHIMVIGFLNDIDQSRISASRILLFSDIPNAVKGASTSQDNTNTSTRSGKKTNF